MSLFFSVSVYFSLHVHPADSIHRMQFDRIECFSFDKPVREPDPIPSVIREISVIMITADQFDLFFSFFKPLNKGFCFVDAFARKEAFWRLSDIIQSYHGHAICPP